MDNLNKEQQKAVLTENKHTMVLAGAGTGKTKTIIHKIIQLIENNKTPSKIAVLTFTRKAASEIIHRLSASLGVRASSIFASTFHHFCLFNIRKYNSFFNFIFYCSCFYCSTNLFTRSKTTLRVEKRRTFRWVYRLPTLL